MKKLLKFILMPIFIGAPALSVVACGNADNGQVSPDELLNIAKGRMTTGFFNMKAQLKLESLPANNSDYNTLSSDNQATITQYFKSLVTTGSGSSAGNWQYPSVDVSISPLVEQNFITNYDAKIQAKITVTANLKYSGLSATKKVTVFIYNDNSTSDEKAQAIVANIEKELNNNPKPINLDTLPLDEIKNNNHGASTIWPKFASSLRKAWFNPNATEPSDGSISPWLIDVIGDVQISVKADPDKPSDPFYKLDNQAISSKAYVTGVIQNLTIGLTYVSPFNTSDIGTAEFKTENLTSAKSIKIQQSTGSDMQNQLVNSMSSEKNITINFSELTNPPSTPPTDTQDLNDYIKDNPSIKDAIDNIIFKGDITGKETLSGIYSVYPKTKVPGLNTEDFSVLTSSKFKIKDPATSLIGSFTVTFQLLDKVVDPNGISLMSNSVDVIINANTSKTLI